MSENEPEETGTVKLKLGCATGVKNVIFKLRKKKVDEWNEPDLNLMSINTDMITSIEVGPKTVLEAYSDPGMYRLRKRIKNGSETGTKKFEIGCFEDHGVWAGIIRSFRIWDYEYYMSIYGTRYCEQDTECREDEYCLCKGGQRKGEWCPESKKRCVHKSKYLHNIDRDVKVGDIVDLDCMRSYLKKKPMMSYGEMKPLLNKCSGPDITYKLQKKYSNDGWREDEIEDTYYFPLKQPIHLSKLNIEEFNPLCTNRNRKEEIMITIAIIIIVMGIIYTYTRNRA